jgi:hypothetical protein
MVCKWEASYFEDVVGDGGPRLEQFDCKYQGDIDIGDSECGRNCPAFEEDNEKIPDYLC